MRNTNPNVDATSLAKLPATPLSNEEKPSFLAGRNALFEAGGDPRSSTIGLAIVHVASRELPKEHADGFFYGWIFGCREAINIMIWPKINQHVKKDWHYRGDSSVPTCYFLCPETPSPHHHRHVLLAQTLWALHAPAKARLSRFWVYSSDSRFWRL